MDWMALNMLLRKHLWMFWNTNSVYNVARLKPLGCLIGDIIT